MYIHTKWGYVKYIEIENNAHTYIRTHTFVYTPAYTHTYIQPVLSCLDIFNLKLD